MCVDLFFARYYLAILKYIQIDYEVVNLRENSLGGVRKRFNPV